MDFGLLPPEINSARMYAGPGSGPMLAAAAAWHTTAAQLESTAAGYFSEISGLTGQMWFGPSSMRMSAAAAPFVAWLQGASAQASQTSAQAYAAAAAYEAAFAMTVPPPVVAANRVQLTALIATNFFGQNTPAIAATEAQYTEMWAQDATAMYTYAATSETASTLTPYDEPPPTTNQAGQDDQAQALARTTANTTSARTQTVVQQASGTVNYTPPAELDPSIPPGTSANVPPGSIINVGSNTTLTVNSGSVTLAPGPVIGGFVVTSKSAITLNPGSLFTAGLGWSSGGTSFPAGPVTVGPGGLILTPTFPNFGATGVLNAGSVTLGAQSTVVTVNDTAIGFAGLSGATITNVGGTVSYSSVSLPGVAALSSSPGLAGTAGIQPQLNAEGLADWARGLGAPTGEAAAAALG